jgi:hypothetical protein
MGRSTRNEARRRYQQAVDTLLAAIAERRGRQHALAARGVQPAGLSDLEGDLQQIRDELAAVIAAGSSAFEPRETIPAAPAPRRRPRLEGRAGAWPRPALQP